MTVRMLILLLTACWACSPGQPSLVSFSHLRHLTERVGFQGDSVDMIHIYADAPSYAWVDAKDEGIACVDDAARAAVLYLRHAELTNDRTSLARAKELLKFVLRMETADGLFHNFLFSDHTVNRSGRTSVASFGWWAGRGVWCFGLGYRLFRDVDPVFAEQLGSGIERTLFHLDTLLHQYGRERIIAGYRVPQWLLYESGSDATSELVLGLVEYYRAKPQVRVRAYIEKLCEGMMIMQDGDMRTFPFGAHRSWETRWHAWGNGQTQALATAGRWLSDERMVASAKREADGFYSRLLILGNQREFNAADTTDRKEFEQIAYDIRPMAVGLLRLHEATGDARYARMAGLAASWLFGNNVASSHMYDSLTGRCYDGIQPGALISANSGAESTIEALMTVLEAEHSPIARAFLFHRKKSVTVSDREIIRTFINRMGIEDAGVRIDLRRGELQVLDKDAVANLGRGSP
jgi:hypothetical protein